MRSGLLIQTMLFNFETFLRNVLFLNAFAEVFGLFGEPFHHINANFVPKTRFGTPFANNWANKNSPVWTKV